MYFRKILALAVCFPGLLVAQRERTLRVATYNVENLFDNFDNPYTADEGTAPKSSADLRVLAATIDGFEADVLALQEVENLGVLRRLNGLLKKPYPFLEILPGNDRRGIHCALMSRVRVKRSIGHRHRALDGARSFARDLPVYELEPSPGASLFVAPVHFKSKRSVGGDKQSNGWRTAEARAVVRILDELSSGGDDSRPFILLGDLNDERDADTLAPVFARFTDATASVPLESRYSYIYSGRKQQIDHVLFAGKLEVGACKFWHAAKGVSDHVPVAVDFAWPANVLRNSLAKQETGAVADAALPRIEASDLPRLRRHLLREVEITGRIHAVEPTNRGGHFNVSFTQDRRKSVSAFVPRHAVARFPKLRELVGKNVKLRGPVFTYRGRLEVKLTRPGQLVVEE